MKKVGKVVRKLIAGEFSELSDRAREELVRRRERKHLRAGADLFNSDKHADIFAAAFRASCSDPGGAIDFKGALRAKKEDTFFYGFGKRDDFARMLSGVDSALAAKLVASADEVLLNRFPIFSLGHISYGDPPKWSFDPVHRREAPEILYADIDYLSFESVGDAKVTWELSRWQFVYDLGQAYLLTGDEKYAAKFLGLISDWSHAHPDYRGINFCSALEFAFRLHSLSWGVYFFKDSASLTDKHARDIYRLAHLSASFLADHLSIWFSPNTHLLGEAYGLYLAGLLFSEFSEATRWERIGREILRAELTNQITEDGMHAELSTAYHAYTMEFLLSTILLAGANGRQLPDIFAERLLDLTNLFITIQRPDGLWPHIGDEDGGRLFWLTRTPSGDYRPILEACRLLLGTDAAKGRVAAYTESFWLVGAEVGVDSKSETRTAAFTGSRSFDHAGLVLSSSPEKRMYSLLQGGPFGHHDCPHSHADMLHIDISVGTDNFLVDPGTFVYTADLAARNRYRSGAMHNGPRLVGEDLYLKDDPFAWNERPDVRLERRFLGSSFCYAKAGWKREGGSGEARFSRSAFLLADSFWLIQDRAFLSRAQPLSWRFISPCAAEIVEDFVILMGQQGDLAIFPACGGDELVTMKIEETTLSTDYLSEARASGICATLPSATDHSIWWLMIPGRGNGKLSGGIQAYSGDGREYIRWRDSSGEHRFVSRSEEDENSTNEAFITYNLVKSDQVIRAVVCGGKSLGISEPSDPQCENAKDYVDIVREGDKLLVDRPQNRGSASWHADK